MATFIRGIGRITCRRGAEFIVIRMVRFTRATSKMTKCMEWAPTSGPMARSTKVAGSPASNTAVASIQTPKA